LYLRHGVRKTKLARREQHAGARHRDVKMAESTLNEHMRTANKEMSSGLGVLLGLIAPTHEEQHTLTKLRIRQNHGISQPAQCKGCIMEHT